MTKGENFIGNVSCKHGHRSAMSNSACCDLNENGTVLKLQDMCHNHKCNCQKQKTFTPKQFQLEGSCSKNTMKKNFKGPQTAWKKFLKPAVDIAAPFIGIAVGAKTKNPKVAQATTTILKSICGVKVLSLTDIHGNGLRLKVM